MTRFAHHTAGTAHLIGTAEANSEEWHEQRDKRIGGSEIGIIMGYNPWVSRFTLYHQKLGLIERDGANKAMEWGNRLEPVVTEAYLDNHPETAKWELTTGDTYVNTAEPWMLAHADALLFHDGELVRGVEVKTGQRESAKSPWNREGWGPSGSADPQDMPYHYYLQILWYMAVFGLREWDVAVLLSGNDDRYYRMPWRAVEADQMIGTCRGFLDRVEKRIAPDLGEDTSTYNTLKLLNPNVDKGDRVVIDSRLAERYIEVCATAKKSSDDRQYLVNKIMAQMGNAQHAAVETVGGTTLVIARRECRYQGSPYLKQAFTGTPKELHEQIKG